MALKGQAARVRVCLGRVGRTVGDWNIGAKVDWPCHPPPGCLAGREGPAPSPLPCLPQTWSRVTKCARDERNWGSRD